MQKCHITSKIDWCGRGTLSMSDPVHLSYSALSATHDDSEQDEMMRSSRATPVETQVRTISRQPSSKVSKGSG